MRDRVLPRAEHLLGYLELVGGHGRWAAVAAAGPGGGQPGAGAFADQVAVELGQGGEDVEDELAAGGGGIDRFLQAPEADAAVGQAGDELARCRRERPSRSSFHTTRVSPGRNWSRSCSRTGRSVRAPLAVWVNLLSALQRGSGGCRRIEGGLR